MVVVGFGEVALWCRPAAAGYQAKTVQWTVFGFQHSCWVPSENWLASENCPVDSFWVLTLCQKRGKASFQREIGEIRNLDGSGHKGMADFGRPSVTDNDDDKYDGGNVCDQDL